MDVNKNRTWAEIDLGAVCHNYRIICEKAKSPVLCVVKADAYGHGAVQVAKRLQELDAPYFAVATMDEALELRENGITKPILILGFVNKHEMEPAVKNRISLPVYDSETAKLVSEAAENAGGEITVHYKLDTGMTRLGFRSWEKENTIREILECSRLPGIKSEGIFTHFAAADVPNGKDYTEMQFSRFSSICDGLKDEGLELPFIHCANSAGIQHYEKTHCTMTRAGIILYGCRPDVSVPYQLDLKPAMTLKARIAQVRDIPKNTSISYGRTFTTDKPEKIAVVTIGYADGFLRTGSGKAHVILNGKKTPVLGRICMDMCMVKIPEGEDVRRGDEATIFGPDALTAEDAAEAAGTISYEILCNVSRRVPRFYFDGPGIPRIL